MRKSETTQNRANPMENRRATTGSREAEVHHKTLKKAHAHSFKPATGKGGRKVPGRAKTTLKTGGTPKNLDEAISANLNAVLDGVTSPASTGLQKKSGRSKENTRRNQPAVEESVATERLSLSRTSSMNRYRTSTTSGESLASSVEDEFVPSFLHLTAAEPEQHISTHPKVDSRDRQRLSKSITTLHKLVNAKIEDVIRKKQSMQSKIPAAPGKVRPVSARSIAATRIPRAKGMQDAAGDRYSNQNRPGVLVVEASPPTSPRQGPRSRRVGRDDTSAEGRRNSSENGLSSASPTSSVGMRDSTEVGLSRLREDLVAGSMALDGQIDEFRSAHRTIANGELNQTSTDQLLSTFVKGSVHQENGSLWDGAAAAIQEADIQEEFIEECYYSDDDFEDLDDVEEESMVFVQESVAPKDISAQAEALYGSLYQLRALMTSPQMSRRQTLAVEASIPEDLASEALEQSLSAVHLSKACAALENALNL